ncbi:hypothetical protein B7760_01243 [Burkholderia glumae]|nr:hypothetical protein B7760_01243 [Burkholderia glumae]
MAAPGQGTGYLASSKPALRNDHEKSAARHQRPFRRGAHMPVAARCPARPPHRNIGVHVVLTSDRQRLVVFAGARADDSFQPWLAASARVAGGGRQGRPGRATAKRCARKNAAGTDRAIGAGRRCRRCRRCHPCRRCRGSAPIPPAASRPRHDVDSHSWNARNGRRASPPAMRPCRRPRVPQTPAAAVAEPGCAAGSRHTLASPSPGKPIIVSEHASPPQRRGDRRHECAPPPV